MIVTEDPSGNGKKRESSDFYCYSSLVMILQAPLSTQPQVLTGFAKQFIKVFMDMLIFKEQ